MRYELTESEWTAFNPMLLNRPQGVPRVDDRPRAWGLMLGPATGHLIAQMMAGEPPFCDPAPYRAERFLS
jgi:glycine/D-amino acid oxidase-like deaminating enzyme